MKDQGTSKQFMVEFLDLPSGPGLGRIAITEAPGKRGKSSVGQYSHDRDLFNDLQQLRFEHQIDALVSLTPSNELQRFHIPNLHSAAQSLGIEVIAFPIGEGQLPKHIQSLLRLLRNLTIRLAKGERVAIQGRGRAGRGGVIAASALIANGVSLTEAIACVQRVSRSALSNERERSFLKGLAAQYDPKSMPSQSDGNIVTLLDRYLGTLVGLKIGSLLGEAALDGFDLSDKAAYSPAVHSTLSREPSSFAYASQHLLAESLIEFPEFNPADQIRRYSASWVDMRSPGSLSGIDEQQRNEGVDRAIRRYQATGATYAGQDDTDSNDAGVLLRVAPIALLYGWYPEGAVALAGEAARTTHGRPVQDACRYLCGLIVGSLQGSAKDTVLGQAFFPDKPGAPGRWPDERPIFEESAGMPGRGPEPLHHAIALLSNGPTVTDLRQERASESPTLIRTLRTALRIYASARTFEAGVRECTRWEREARGVTAIFGMLAGAQLGIRQLPSEWVMAAVDGGSTYRHAHSLLQQRHEAERTHLEASVRPHTRKVMEAVSHLHQMGYGRLRLMAYVGGPGFWRHGIMPPSMGLANGRMTPVEGEYPFIRGSNSVFHWPLSDVETVDSWMVALRLISRHRKDVEEGLGTDSAYVAWYQWMLTHIGAGDTVFGFSEFLTPPSGYIVASTPDEDVHFIPEPPPRPSGTEGRNGS